jgi:hypothetical protein
MAPVDVRVAAVRSLSKLQHLEQLDFSVTDDEELVAVALVASELAHNQLQELRLLVQDDCSVSNFGMLGLAQLSRFADLQVWLLKPDLLILPQPARVFVAGLAGVDSLCLIVDTEVQRVCLSGAVHHVEWCGLPLPGEHSISTLD